MKIKPITLLLTCGALLVSCGSNEPASTSTTAPESSSAGPTYLTFVEQGKLRVDIFNVTDVNFSYGNSALSEANNVVSLDANSSFSVNKNSETDKFHIIFFAEDGSRHSVKYYGPDGDSLVEAFSLGGVKNYFASFASGRGYCAISTGATASWTKGLNEKMDAEIQGFIPSN